MRGYPHFSFWIPITLAKIHFFPVVITFASVLGGTVLKTSDDQQSNKKPLKQELFLFERLRFV